MLDKREQRCYNSLRCLRENLSAVGVYNIEVPPVPIPNTVVKLNCAENTWRVAAREDKSSPTQTSVSDLSGTLFLIVKNRTDRVGYD